MGPIPGLSWVDVREVVIALASAILLLGIQWYQADTMAPPGRTRDAARTVLIAVIVPFLIVSQYRTWLPTPDPVRIAATVLWLGGTILVRLSVTARESALGRLRTSSSDEPRLNTLARARPANVLFEATGDLASHWSFTEQRASIRPRAPGFLAVVVLAGMFTAPRAVIMVATQTPCEQVEVLLAARNSESAQARPEEWMPALRSGYQMSMDGPTTLELEAQSRKNPDESRVELARDGFLRGHKLSWYHPDRNLEFAAQEFKASEGALEFHAFANRYACQFANETFRGPRGSIGLQIRYSTGRPITEQLSWVSGRTRIIVAVDHDAPPADHSRVESLLGLISVR